MLVRGLAPPVSRAGVRAREEKRAQTVFLSTSLFAFSLPLSLFGYFVFPRTKASLQAAILDACTSDQKLDPGPPREE